MFSCEYRFLQHNPGQPLPALMSKNAQLVSQRRQKLMEVRDETMAIYESQREAVRSGSISLASLPQLSPPSLMVSIETVMYIIVKFFIDLIISIYIIKYISIMSTSFKLLGSLCHNACVLPVLLCDVSPMH